MAVHLDPEVPSDHMSELLRRAIESGVLPTIIQKEYECSDDPVNVTGFVKTWFEMDNCPLERKSGGDYQTNLLSREVRCWPKRSKRSGNAG